MVKIMNMSFSVLLIVSILNFMSSICLNAQGPSGGPSSVRSPRDTFPSPAPQSLPPSPNTAPGPKSQPPSTPKSSSSPPSQFHPSFPTGHGASSGLNGGRKAAIVLAVLLVAGLLALGGKGYLKRQRNIKRRYYGNAARAAIL